MYKPLKANYVTTSNRSYDGLSYPGWVRQNKENKKKCFLTKLVICCFLCSSKHQFYNTVGFSGTYNKLQKFKFPLVHSCTIFLCCLDYPYSHPNMNNKDHRVGLLTKFLPNPRCKSRNLSINDIEEWQLRLKDLESWQTAFKVLSCENYFAKNYWLKHKVVFAYWREIRCSLQSTE